MGVGLRLKKILRDRKMTIKRLAEETGIPVNTLYSITKRDSERVDPVIIQKIAEALIVSPALLMGVGNINEKGQEEIDLFGVILELSKSMEVDWRVVETAVNTLGIAPFTAEDLDKIVEEVKRLKAQTQIEKLTQIEEENLKDYLDSIGAGMRKLNDAGQSHVASLALSFANELARLPEYQRNPDKK